MTTVGIFLLILWFSVAGLSLRITRDIASPQLMLCAIFFFFFFDIFITDHSIYLYGIYIISLLIVLISSFFNIPLKQYSVPLLSKKESLPHIGFWLLSLPSLIAMLYMIEMFGGLVSYIVAAQWGTRSFWGLGPLKSIIGTFFPISLLYFALLISNERGKWEYAFFILHFFLLITLALLTLSRGTLLTQIVFMVLVYHFSRKRLSTFFVSGGLISLLVFASVYGVVRESLNVSEGEIDLGLEDREQFYRSEWMEFGTFPFERIINAPHVEKHLGSTYITAITNFIPRTLWPEKPSPGGVVFTNEYASEFYDEFSHFTTGLYPEAMMNFGLHLGLFMGVLQFALLCFLLTFYYRRMIYRNSLRFKTPKDTLSLVIYIYVVWAAVALLTGEFTSIVVGLILKLIVLYLVFNLISIKMSRIRI